MFFMKGLAMSRRFLYKFGDLEYILWRGAKNRLMKAAQLTGPKQFDVIDTDVPQIADGQCLVKLERWSVSIPLD